MRGAYTITHSGIPVNGGGWNNQQLLKDCGLVLYLLQKNHGFHSVLVGMKVDASYPYLEQYIRELELDFLSEDTLKARLAYVDAHANDIDLLILYGAYPDYIPLVEHYKHVRSDGKIYLATDMNIAWAERLPHEESAYKKFLHSCDVISTSSRTTQKYLSTKWSVPVDLIRNGWYNFFGVKFDDMHKENIILEVSSNYKQNNVLLEAFAKVASELPDWNVRLVGDVEENFKSYVEKYFEIHPDLRGRVTFTGAIEDKVLMMDEYKRAKIFCLTSKFEGVPNVAKVALFSGDYIISAAIEAADEITDEGNCGGLFPIDDVESLKNLLLEVCRDDKLIRDGGRKAQSYAREQFDANKIVARLNYLLYGGDVT